MKRPFILKALWNGFLDELGDEQSETKEIRMSTRRIRSDWLFHFEVVQLA
jgi:hypothetical protein